MQAQTSPQPMCSHGPGWTWEAEDGTSYQLWAPQAAHVIRDPKGFPGMWSTGGGDWHEDAQAPRTHWAANWQTKADPDDEDDYGQGDFVRAPTMDEALRIFPPDVAATFREVVADD